MSPHPEADARSDAGTDHLREELIAIGRERGLTAVGVADAHAFADTRHDLDERRRGDLHGGMQFTYRNPERSTDPGRIIPGARSLVVGALSYRSEDPVTEADGKESRPKGRVARYSWQDYYEVLRKALARVAERLVSDGWRATVVCDDNSLVDRAAAHRAGLGWFGKNSLILLPGLGSWFVLGAVVTDAALLSPDADRPVPAQHGEGCGSCSRCMTACPTGALAAPGVLDARRCLAWLVQAPGTFPLEYREALGGRIYGCDECQQVCPINRLADRRDPPVRATGAVEAEVDLIDLIGSSDDTLLTTFGRWYFPNREPRYLRRNALVALGNVGDGRDPATEFALRRALDDIDPMIVEHAAWAAGRMGRSDLVEEEK
jgi:epoxyqueuosine reductase